MKNLSALVAATSLLTAASALPNPINHFSKRQATVPIGGTTIPSRVTLPCGVVDVLGQTNTALNVSSYLSIPFAQPPVGDLRFVAPQEYVYQPGEVNATVQGPACVQIPGGSLAGTSGFSEDCLTLNVYTPAGVTNTSSLPVFVWIYGGGFVEGTAGTYDATGLIAESLQTQSEFVFVAMNYRLSVWGFMQGREAAANNASNLGLLDQLEAVKWVKTNIASFGGNPDHVVIGGQSAGAISASLQLFNPNVNATDLYKGLILESGSPNTYPIGPVATTRQEVFDLVANMTGCAANASSAGDYSSEAYSTQVFQCLKYVDEATLANATLSVLELPQYRYSNFPWGPAYGDNVVPNDPYVEIQAGNYPKLPFISGDNLDEGSIFAPALGEPLALQNETQAIDFLKLITPANVNVSVAEELLSFYTDISMDSPYQDGNASFSGYSGNVSLYRQVSSLLGDVSFNEPRRAWLQSNEKYGNNQTWSYLFAENSNSSSLYGVAHGDEVIYVFLGPVADAKAYTPAQQMLSEQIGAYWINFVNTLNPNGVGPIAQIVASKLNATEWPAYSSGAGANQLWLEAGNNYVIQDTYRADAFDYINSLGPAIAH